MKKKRKGSGLTVPIALVVLFVVLAVSVIIWGLYQYEYIWRFQNDLKSLCSQSNTCIGETDGERVIVSGENTGAIYSLIQSAKGRLRLTEPEALDSVTFTFIYQKTPWTLQIDKISDEEIHITMAGDSSYSFYLDSHDRFEDYKKIAGLEGYITENMPMAVENE